MQDATEESLDDLLKKSTPDICRKITQLKLQAPGGGDSHPTAMIRKNPIPEKC